MSELKLIFRKGDARIADSICYSSYFWNDQKTKCFRIYTIAAQNSTLDKDTKLTYKPKKLYPKNYIVLLKVGMWCYYSTWR